MADSDWISKMALKHAERLASAGKFEQAQQILRDVRAENQITQTQSRVLSASVQASLAAQLKLRFPDHSVYPLRAVDSALLKQAGLRAFDAYVFSLLDGGTSIDDVIALTPALEIDTLASLRKLLDLQLITLDAEPQSAKRQA